MEIKKRKRNQVQEVIGGGKGQGEGKRGVVSVQDVEDQRMGLSRMSGLLMLLMVMLLMLNWVAAVSAQVQQQRRILFDREIKSPEGKLWGSLTIYEGEEPVDVVARFQRQHALMHSMREQILQVVCAKVKCHRNTAVVYANRIQNAQGRDLGVLTIYEEQEPADIVYAFASQAGLTAQERHSLLGMICQQAPCTRKNALLFSQNIVIDNDRSLGRLNIYDNEEPVDKIYELITQQNSTHEIMNQLLQSVCRNIHCTRANPLLFSQTIVLENNANVGRLDIYAGQEPVDVIHAFAQAHGLDKQMRQNILYSICSQNKQLKCKWNSPIVLSSPVVNEDGIDLGVLSIREDEEVADAVYRFSMSKNVSRSERLNIVQNVCNTGREGFKCTRGDAILYRNTISDENGAPVGDLIVYEEQEAADVIYNFARERNLEKPVWSHLIENICSSGAELLNCTRKDPIIFAAPIAAENGSYLGHIFIHDNEEPVDALATFTKKHSLRDDQKKTVLEGICRVSGIPCNRDKPLVLRTMIHDTDGRPLGQIEILDEVEPADTIYEFGLRHGFDFNRRKALLSNLCYAGKEKFNCTRSEAKILSLPIHEGPGKILDTLEILETEEPVDAIYTFMAKNELFQTEPINTTLVDLVCNMTQINCTRREPRRTLFSLQATYMGLPHSIRYLQPEEDWVCISKDGGRKCTHYVNIFAEEYCNLHMPDWQTCADQIGAAVRTQLDYFEESVWKGKDLYAKLGLLRIATLEQIDSAYHKLVLRYNNETQPEKYIQLKDAYEQLSDAEKKYYYDLPCVKMFGLCAKRQADGGMQITPA